MLESADLTSTRRLTSQYLTASAGVPDPRSIRAIPANQQRVPGDARRNDREAWVPVVAPGSSERGQEHLDILRTNPMG